MRLFGFTIAAVWCVCSWAGPVVSAQEAPQFSIGTTRRPAVAADRQEATPPENSSWLRRPLDSRPPDSAQAAGAARPDEVASPYRPASVLEVQRGQSPEAPSRNAVSSPVAERAAGEELTPSAIATRNAAETTIPHHRPSTGTPLSPPSGAPPASVGPAPGSGWQTLTTVGSSLLVVLGLFCGVAWCYRRSMGAVGGGQLPKHVLQVLGRSTVGPRQQLILLRVGPKLVLVSSIQGEMRSLTEITDPLEVDRIMGECESAQPGSVTQSFRSILAQGDAR